MHQWCVYHAMVMDEIYFLPLLSCTFLNICDEHVLMSLKKVQEHSLKSVEGMDGCIFLLFFIISVLASDWHFFSPRKTA